MTVKVKVEQVNSVSQERYMEGFWMRMMKTIERSIGTGQGGFTKGMGYVDQIFLLKILIKMYLEKDLKKAYDRVGRKDLRDLLRI